MQIKQYMVWFSGSGEGCDYTIGCNEKCQVFNAFDETSLAEMIAEAVLSYGEDTIESYRVFPVDRELDCRVGTLTQKFIEEIMQRHKREDADVEHQHDVAEFERLRKKLGK